MFCKAANKTERTVPAFTLNIEFCIYLLWLKGYIDLSGFSSYTLCYTAY